MSVTDLGGKRTARSKARPPAPPEIMGTWEVAEFLGVNRTNLQFIKDLPEPTWHLKASRIWLGSDIREFAKTYQLRRAARAG